MPCSRRACRVYVPREERMYSIRGFGAFSFDFPSKIAKTVKFSKIFEIGVRGVQIWRLENSSYLSRTWKQDVDNNISEK